MRLPVRCGRFAASPRLLPVLAVHRMALHACYCATLNVGWTGFLRADVGMEQPRVNPDGAPDEITRASNCRLPVLVTGVRIAQTSHAPLPRQSAR
jgi:hypothetical protein